MSLLGLSQLLASSAVPVQNVRRPHILLVVADDLGFNDVGFHGSKQIPTPNMDALAATGVQLDGYYVQPVCSPTRSCVMTGRHVIHSGIYDPDCSLGTTNAVPRNFTMLPKRLKALGYETHAVGKWHLGAIDPETVPTGRGFDTFYGYYSGAEDYFHHNVGGVGGKKQYLDIHDDIALNTVLRPAYGIDGQYSTHLYASRAERIIKQHAAAAASGPLFMYLAWQAIHSPDEVPDAYRNAFNGTIPPDGAAGEAKGTGLHRRIVAGMVACLDEGMGNVTDALKSAGMMKDTVIFFTADNGGPAEGFNSNMASNWPLRGMKRTLWEGGVRATAFITGAGLRKTGYVSHAMLHVTDIPISLLALALNGLDADPTDKASWKDWHELVGKEEPRFQLGDGVDAFATLATGEASPRTEIIHEAHQAGHEDGNGQAIRVGDLKLIFEKGPMWHGPPNDLWYKSGSMPSRYTHTVDCGGSPPGSTAPGYCDPAKLPCVFNITADPCEFVDLSQSHPELVAPLVARLKAYQATAVPKGFHELAPCSAEALKNANPSNHPLWNGSWMPFCGTWNTSVAETAPPSVPGGGSSNKEVTVSIIPHVYHNISTDFNCWTIDASENRGWEQRNLSDPKLLYLASQSKVGYMRFGGGGNDDFAYAVGNPSRPTCPPPSPASIELLRLGKQLPHCLNETWFNNLMSFAQASGAKLIFALAVNNTKEAFGDSWWDPTDARYLLKYAIERYGKNAIYGFELGNEQNKAYTAAEEAANFATLHKLLVELYGADEVPKLVGPDPHGYHGPPSPPDSTSEFLVDFAQNMSSLGVPLLALTHHEYVEVDEYLTVKSREWKNYFETLDKVGAIAKIVNQTLRESGVETPIWIGESGPHNGASPGVLSDKSMRWNNFADSFWYLDAMASKAAHGYSAFCRQDFIGIDYALVDAQYNTPLPDYYAHILWSTVMGTGVLATKSSSSETLRAYAHCSADRTGIAVLLINLDSKAASVTLTGLSSISTSTSTSTSGSCASQNNCPRKDYILTGPNGTNSSEVALNGKLLMMTETGKLPSMAPKEMKGIGTNVVKIEGAAIAFVVLEGDFTDAGC